MKGNRQWPWGLALGIVTSTLIAGIVLLGIGVYTDSGRLVFIGIVMMITALSIGVPVEKRFDSFDRTESEEK